MNAKIWLPLLAAAVMLAACDKHDDGVPITGDPAKTGDQSTTPGGIAGESAAQPAQTNASPADDPPATASPSEPTQRPPQ